jgi:hypothetical protein
MDRHGRHIEVSSFQSAIGNWRFEISKDGLRVRSPRPLIRTFSPGGGEGQLNGSRILPPHQRQRMEDGMKFQVFSVQFSVAGTKIGQIGKFQVSSFQSAIGNWRFEISKGRLASSIAAPPHPNLLPRWGEGQLNGSRVLPPHQRQRMEDGMKFQVFSVQFSVGGKWSANCAYFVVDICTHV